MLYSQSIISGFASILRQVTKYLSSKAIALITHNLIAFIPFIW